MVGNDSLIPKNIHGGKASEESNMYSFGVMALWIARTYEGGEENLLLRNWVGLTLCGKEYFGCSWWEIEYGFWCEWNDMLVHCRALVHSKKGQGKAKGRTIDPSF